MSPDENIFSNAFQSTRYIPIFSRSNFAGEFLSALLHRARRCLNRRRLSPFFSPLLSANDKRV